MRKFIRHPSDIPIKYELDDVTAYSDEYLKNISQGGLCFFSKIEIAAGTLIHIRIPLLKPVIEVDGFVVWSRRTEGHYEVGVSFKDANTEFRVRMVEQVCHIEHYKREILEKEGRSLTGEEAAVEWIAKYAENFPR